MAEPAQLGSVRDAGERDFAAIAQLDREVSPVLPGAEHYRRLVGAGGTLLVIDAGTDIAAFAAAQQVLDEVTLLNIAVVPTLRRRQCARMLLRELIARARRRGGRRLLLELRDSNSAARTLYEQLGFRLDGRRPNYYPARDAQPAEDAVLMSLALES